MRWIAVAATPLAVLAVLAALGYGPLVETSRDPEALRWHTAYLATVAVVLALTRAAPDARDGVLVAASLSFLILGFGAPLAATLLLAIVLLALVLRLPAAPRAVLMVAWCAIFVFWLPPRYFLHLPQRMADLTAVEAVAAIVAAFVFSDLLKRAAWLCIEAGAGLRWRFVDLLVYMIGLPNLLGKTATPSFAQFLRSRGEPSATFRQGLDTVGICLGWLAAFMLARRFIPWRLPELESYGFTGAWGIAMTVRVMDYVRRLANQQLSVGIWRMLGYGLGDDFHGPLRATSVVDYWRRWNMLWRPFLMQTMYYPLMLTLGRRFGTRPAWVHMVAATVTFLGSGFFDFLPWGWYVFCAWPDEAASLAASFLLYHLLGGLLVGAGLAVEARRPRAEVGTVRKAANTGATFVLLSGLGVLHRLWPSGLRWAVLSRMLGL